MAKIIKTKPFGDIDVKIDEGFYGDITDGNNGQTIHLDIFKEIKLDSSYLKIVEYLDNYQDFNNQAKTFILKELNERNTVAEFYYDFHKEELQDELKELLAYKELSNENLVSSTRLTSIWFSLEKEEIVATFDYKLLEEFSDELLVIRFNQNKEIIGISHES